MAFDYDKALKRRISRHAELVERPNRERRDDGGALTRWRHPVLTPDHVPLTWRVDLERRRNPFLLERLGVHAIPGAGAIEHRGRVALVVRVEGKDRKSFFAVAESDSGVDGFRFRDPPLQLPEAAEPETTVSDMRLTRHEDGWIYGVYGVERQDPDAPVGDTSRALARVALVRTRDLVRFERLADLRSHAVGPQSVALHPRLVRGQYAFYTRAQSASVEVEGHAPGASGIGFALCENIEQAEIAEEALVDARAFQTFKESRATVGPPPIETDKGFLHVAQGTRTTAAGLRSVLYAFLCDPEDPTRVLYAPGDYLLAAAGEELNGDVASGLACAGAVARASGEVLIYYGAAETRLHVASTSIGRLLDYVKHAPPDAGSSRAAAAQRAALAERNLKLVARRSAKTYRGLR